jgi:L-aspartate oxidase
VDVRGDFLVIGSGIAGLRAAISLAGTGDVLVLTKAERSESNTGYAQGGIAAAVGADDSPELHARDTMAAGDGLCDERAVRILVEDGPRYVGELIEWGAAFDREPGGRVALGREGAHSVRRVLHARDATGREISRVLWQRVSTLGRIQVIDAARVTDLVVEAGTCVGAGFVDASGSYRVARARATLLATGGAGQVFRETTNPPIATGDGVAIGFRAGARVADLEFVQFHPTALSVPGTPPFLLSEALRGEGARLVNGEGEPFMPRYEPAGDLASRDRVSRAMVRESKRTGAPVYLSLAHLDAEYVRARFPSIAEACRQAGLDLAKDRIPVSPAAHYVMGGVETDVDGRTSLPGLYAAGEVACTGVHGANRLASNSLLEGLVFGARAAGAMAGPARAAQTRAAAVHDVACRPCPGTPAAFPSEGEVRDLMWRQAGLLRDRDGLALAARMLETWWTVLRGAGRAEHAAADRRRWRVESLVTVGMLMARAALRREESRGGHFRADFPVRDDPAWRLTVADRLADVGVQR